MQKVESVIEKSVQRIGTFKRYPIWTQEHVKYYLNEKKVYIWILRVKNSKNWSWQPQVGEYMLISKKMSQ